jgi:hypothetical protein
VHLEDYSPSYSLLHVLCALHVRPIPGVGHQPAVAKVAPQPVGPAHASCLVEACWCRHVTDLGHETQAPVGTAHAHWLATAAGDHRHVVQDP